MDSYGFLFTMSDYTKRDFNPDHDSHPMLSKTKIIFPFPSTELNRASRLILAVTKVIFSPY